MTPIVYACVAVALAIIIYTITRKGAKTPGCTKPSDCPSNICTGGVCQPCTASTVCPLGQTCISGVCRAPAPAPTSCYKWTTWNSVKDNNHLLNVPAGVAGADMPTDPGDAWTVPVSKQDVNGEWLFGNVDYGGANFWIGPPDDYKSLYGNTNDLYSAVVAPGSSCPTTFQSTTDPTKALQFQGNPVCADFTPNVANRTYYPYVEGGCIGPAYAKLSLIKDFSAAA